MNPRELFSHAGRVLAALFLLSASGCLTLQTREDAVAQEELDRATQQSVARLKTQVEAILAQQDQIQQQMQQLRLVAQDRVTATDLERSNANLKTQIADLERRLAALDSARAQDKQEIVGTLSRNMASALAAQQKSQPRSSTPTAKPAYSGKAYKHTVAAGDTLSAIASAYKVPASSIVSANSLKSPYTLRVGQEILVPAQ